MGSSKMSGAINKIVLENFMTYEHLEIFPGKHMNLIIGPNGSGKSSILCGICFGLGGKPKTIGRVTQIGDYVKNGCNIATIYIELDNLQGRTYVITRQITREGRSTWSLNGKECNQKKIEEKVLEMSIQMDNLCQFLSQERVQDFSKMNSKDLLLNTEKTVGTQDMYNNHMKLIELRKSQHGDKNHVAALKENLEKGTQKCSELKEQVESVRERLGLLKENKNLKAKRPWCVYNAFLNEDLHEVKADYKLASDHLKEKSKDAFPKEKALNSLKQKIIAIREEIKKKATPGHELQKSLVDQQQLYQKIFQNERSTQQQRKLEEERISELKLIETKLKTCEDTLKDLFNNFDETSHDQIKTQAKEIQNLDREIQGLTSHQGTMVKGLSRFESDLRDLENQRQRLLRIDDQRLHHLQLKNPAAYKSTLWMRENGKNFKGLTYGALILEINVKEPPKNAKYVDFLIAGKDKVALVCELAEDMNNIVPMLKKEGHTKVNMLQSANVEPNITIPYEDLRRCGFDCSVVDLFTCPLPIYSYLCRNNHLHDIPIAYKETVDLEAAKKRFSAFFIGDNFFKISKSAYSGEIYTRMIPLRESVFLNLSVNPKDIEKVERKMKDIQTKRFVEQEEVDKIKLSLQEKEKEREVLREQRKVLRTHLDKITETKLIRERYLARINSYQKQSQSVEKNLMELRNDSKVCVEKLCKTHPVLIGMLKEAHKQSINLSLLKMEEKALNYKFTDLQLKHNDTKKSLMDLKEIVEDMYNRVKNMKREAKMLHDAAKDATGVSPGERGFEKFQEIFSSLPDTVEEIDALISDHEVRLQLMGDGDTNILEDYEKQKKLVEKLESDLRNAKLSQEEKDLKMENVRENWLPPLRELADKISANYERLFAHMKCVGEVVLIEGNPETEDDYENYGLQIRVKFRNEEILQDLCDTQSGGERSVSTAIYLLALQELTKVPFRCLDEINQGMDPQNERRIMELMMKMSDSEESCQYFLVSPKLLEDLWYADSSITHIVCQPKRMDTTKWSNESIITSTLSTKGQKKQRSN